MIEQKTIVMWVKLRYSVEDVKESIQELSPYDQMIIIQRFEDTLQQALDEVYQDGYSLITVIAIMIFIVVAYFYFQSFKEI